MEPGKEKHPFSLPRSRGRGSLTERGKTKAEETATAHLWALTGRMSGASLREEGGEESGKCATVPVCCSAVSAALSSLRGRAPGLPARPLPHQCYSPRKKGGECHTKEAEEPPPSMRGRLEFRMTLEVI